MVSRLGYLAFNIEVSSSLLLCLNIFNSSGNGHRIPTYGGIYELR